MASAPMIQRGLDKAGLLTTVYLRRPAASSGAAGLGSFEIHSHEKDVLRT